MSDDTSPSGDAIDTPPPPPVAEALKPTLGGRLRAYFFAGILITAPISITFYIAWQFINFVDRNVVALLPDRYNPATYLPISIPGLGLIMVVVGLTLVGMLTAGFIGRVLTKTSETLLQRMPVISGIYSAVKQILETIFSQKGQAFREVVLIEYPRRGIWTLGFITGTAQGEVGERFDEEMVNVFVPTTPNPTSGFLLFLPRRSVVVLDMAVDDGLKMVISTGIVMPQPRWKGPDRRKRDNAASYQGQERRKISPQAEGDASAGT